MKVSSVRSNRDLTQWRRPPSTVRHGGWWKFGGLLHKVYVRKIDTIDIEDVRGLPRLGKVAAPPRSRCAASCAT